MATIRYLGDEARHVVILPDDARVIWPDELFDVPDEHAESYTQQQELYRREDGDD